MKSQQRSKEAKKHAVLNPKEKKAAKAAKKLAMLQPAIIIIPR